METKQNHPPQPPQIGQSFVARYSIALKTIVVGIVTLLLLIPLGMVQSLIRERQGAEQSVVDDISSKWGGEQTIAGPCLIVPYTETVVEEGKAKQVTRQLLLLPETLDVDAGATVEKRKRGIYDVSVYRSEVGLKGEFDLATLTKSGVKPAQIEWDNMQVIIGLSDLKGVVEQVAFATNGRIIAFEPGLDVKNLAVGNGTAMSSGEGRNFALYDYRNQAYSLFTVGLNAKLDSIQAAKTVPFSVSLKMNGSQGWYVVPVGKTTTARMHSPWPSPSFDGAFLPGEREVSAAGFSSSWKVLDLNRSYGQVFRADNNSSIDQMAASRFGVRFMQPVDQYRQNMRSVKYAVLIILLTFVIVFFIELIKGKSVNPLQYLLVGLALVLFYALLLSLSEIFGFDLSYLTAALMTTVLIAVQMGSVLKSRKQGILVGVLLAFLYLFIYVLIEMESYSLLVGSLVLFAILGVIMYYSKKIKIGGRENRG